MVLDLMLLMVVGGFHVDGGCRADGIVIGDGGICDSGDDSGGRSNNCSVVDIPTLIRVTFILSFTVSLKKAILIKLWKI